MSGEEWYQIFEKLGIPIAGKDQFVDSKGETVFVVHVRTTHPLNPLLDTIYSALYPNEYAIRDRLEYYLRYKK